MLVVVEGDVGCMGKGLSFIVAEGGVEEKKTGFEMADRHWFAIGPKAALAERKGVQGSV